MLFPAVFSKYLAKIRQLDVKNDLIKFSDITVVFNRPHDMPLLQLELKKYILPKRFYQRNTAIVRESCSVRRSVMAGRIIETDAYLSAGDNAVTETPRYCKYGIVAGCRADSRN